MRKLATRKDLKSVWGIPFSPQWLLKLETAGRFPQRVKLGNFVFYYWDEIDAWVASIPRAANSHSLDGE